MASFFRVLIASLLFCACGSAMAAINALSAVGPTGGTVLKVIYGGTSGAAFLINTGGFYRSVDGGVTWKSVDAFSNSVPTDVAADPSDPTRIYVVRLDSKPLWVSTNGGDTWAAVPTLSAGSSVATNVVVSHDGATICLAVGAGLKCSVDRGQTWQARGGVVSTFAYAAIHFLSMSATDSNTLYAIGVVSNTTTAILVTHDGGLTWLQLPATSNATAGAFQVAVPSTNPTQIWSAQSDGVWVSNDGGQHWTKVITEPTSSVTIDPVNPAVIYIGEYSGRVLRSGNSGSSWVDVTGNLVEADLSSIAVNPSQNSQLLIGGTTGAALSSTSGVTWSPANTGYFGTSVTGFSADPTTDRIYISVPLSGLFYVENGSDSVLPVNNPALNLLEPLIYPVYIGPILAQPGSLLVSLTTGLARSADGGATWSLLPPVPFADDLLRSLISSATAPQVLLAGSDNAVFRSTNGGASWTPSTTGLPPQAGIGTGIGGLRAAPSDPNVFYGYFSSTSNSSGATVKFGAYRTTDAGVTWNLMNGSAATGPDGILTVDPTDAKVLYGTGNTNGTAAGVRLLKSVDGGLSWSPLNWDMSVWTQEALALEVDPLHPQILYVSTIMGLGRSVDGGGSWQIFRGIHDFPWWNSWALKVDPKRPEMLLVSTASSGVQQITFAPDMSLKGTPPASPVAVGAAAIFSYTVSDRGPFDATGVVVRLQLPATAQQIAATTPDGSCTVASSLVTCTFAIVRTGVSTTIAVTATTPSAGPFPVSGSVTADQPDADTTNNAVASTTTVAMLADVSVAATGTTTAHVGDAVSFSVVARNAGPNVALATTLNFPVPVGLNAGTVSSTAGTCVVASGSISCSLGDLAVASPVTVTVNATAASPGSVTSTATATTAATDTVSANNTASVTTVITAVAPATPPASSGGSGGGGGMSWWEMFGLMLCLLVQVCQASRSRVSPWRTTAACRRTRRF